MFDQKFADCVSPFPQGNAGDNSFTTERMKNTRLRSSREFAAQILRHSLTTTQFNHQSAQSIADGCRKNISPLPPTTPCPSLLCRHTMIVRKAPLDCTSGSIRYSRPGTKVGPPRETVWEAPWRTTNEHLRPPCVDRAVICCPHVSCVQSEQRMPMSSPLLLAFIFANTVITSETISPFSVSNAGCRGGEGFPPKKKMQHNCEIQICHPFPASCAT